MTQRWKNRPEGSNWGEFGADDRIGRVNWITAEKVKQGIAEVREGRTFCLSLPLEYPGGNLLNPRRFPPQLFAVVRRRPSQYGAAALHVRSESDGRVERRCRAALSAVFHAMGQLRPYRLDVRCRWRRRTRTRLLQWLARRQRCAGCRGSPCRRAAAGAVPSKGTEPLGIHNFAKHGLQGRGVLVNLHDACGDTRTWVGYDLLMKAMETQKVEVEQGDMLCFYTGFGDVLMSMGRKPDHHRLENSCAVLDGRDAKLRNWITDSKVSCLIADNYAVEGLPAKAVEGSHAMLPLHEHCLFKLGVPLGELWYLSDLAAYLKQHKRNRFLLTAPPLRLTGAVGSPASPIATV